MLLTAGSVATIVLVLLLAIQPYPAHAGATAHTMTARGEAQIDTAQSNFGGASGLFDGTGDYLSTPDHADWYFATKDFTIDAWVRFPSLTADTHRYSICSQGTDDYNWWGFELKNDGGVYAWRFLVMAGGSIIINIGKTATVATNTWYHVPRPAGSAPVSTKFLLA